MAAAFLTTLLLTNHIGAAGYGAYAWALSWVYLLLIPSTLGLDRLLLREIPVLLSAGRHGALRGLLRRGHQAVLGTAIVLAVLASITGLALAPRAETITPNMVQALVIGLIMLPLFAVLRLRQTVLLARRRIIAGQLGELAVMPWGFLVAVGGVAILAPATLSAETAMITQLAALAVALAVTLVIGHRALPGAMRVTAPEFAHRRWLTAALPMLLVAGMQVLNQRVDILMVGSLLGAERAGVYAVANRGAQLILLIFYAVNQPLAPVVAQLFSENRRDRLQNLLTRSTRIMLALAVPAAGLMIVFAGPFLSLFGEGFDEGRPALIVMAAAQVAVMAFGSVSTLLQMTGLEKAAALGVGLSAAANVVLNLLLIPHFGMLGAAWALAVGQTGAVGLMAAVAWRKHRLNVTPFGKTL